MGLWSFTVKLGRGLGAVPTKSTSSQIFTGLNYVKDLGKEVYSKKTFDEATDKSFSDMMFRLGMNESDLFAREKNYIKMLAGYMFLAIMSLFLSLTYIINGHIFGMFITLLLAISFFLWCFRMFHCFLQFKRRTFEVTWGETFSAFGKFIKNREFMMYFKRQTIAKK